MARNKTIKFGIGLLMVTVVSAGWMLHMTDEGRIQLTAPAHAQQQQPATAVSVVTVTPQSVQQSRTLPGRVSAYRQSPIRPQVDGIVTERLFEEGAHVEKGQQLYQIDDARYKAAVASAEADLKSAQANVKSVKSLAERYEKLIKIQAVSRQEYDDAMANLDQAEAAISVAQAAVDVAQVELDYTKVYAPISGDIGRSLVTVGSLVTANQSDSMAVITQLDPVYVDMQLSGVELAKIKSQMVGEKSVPVKIMIGENNEIAYQHEGELKFSEVTVDESTGSVTLRAVVPNPEGVLMPGLFVRAELLLDKVQALLVPQRAAIRGADGGLSVWVVNADNTVTQKKITVSDSYESNWIVTDGLSDGDTVIVEGYQKVREGASVNPAPWEANNAESPAKGQTK